MTDLVNHPPHYKANGIEAIDVIEAFGLGFHLGNVTKYVLRSGRKLPLHQDQDNVAVGFKSRLDDLRKAQWYLAREIERETKAAATWEAFAARCEKSKRRRK
jgi:hypothetical protein